MKIANLEKKQIDLIEESIFVYERCMQCRDLYRKNELCFSVVNELVDDKGQSHLFRLKEISHELFRRSNEANNTEKLYDITIGYIFHEAMKLRENVYQLEYYTPQCDITMQDLSIHEKKVVHEIGLLVKKAELRLKEGFKEIKILVNELMEQLKELIILYQNNYLLPRFLLEHEKAVVKIYGMKSFNKLLSSIYTEGRKMLFYKAGYSYLESEYYDIARNLFKKSLHMDSGNNSAVFLFAYSSAYHFYFRNMFTRSLQFAEEAHRLHADEALKKIYLPKLKELKDHVTTEMKKRA